MKKLFYSLIAILFVTSMTSCNPEKQFEKQLVQIDSALVVIDSLEVLMDGIEFDSLKMMVDHVVLNEGFVKNFYVSDTINESLGNHLNEAKSVRKVLKGVETKKMFFGDELNALKHQLQDLKEDVKAGLFSEEQLNKYLANEMQAVLTVTLSFDDFNKKQIAEKKRYYHATPSIDEFIELLKHNLED
ncbi:hypothetical protein [Crocinitomix catalasitica]|uniref:hypothetical protein n=1 Tax=Crocinitomix catalasitica TaxID=184607 RepID=UPI00048052EB|nr:hypothetical protein [Crocinitomix catalasitica]